MKEMFARLSRSTLSAAAATAAAAMFVGTSPAYNTTATAFCDAEPAKSATKVVHLIDHTVLKPNTTVKDIHVLCGEATTHGFAAVCVPPYFVALAKELLGGDNAHVKTATVIGFPFGYSSIAAKKVEIKKAIREGCDEVDVVANIAAIENGDWDYLIDEIYALLPLVRKNGRKIKVIIESGILSDEQILKCCEIHGKAGVDYLKTSTGYAAKGASGHAVKLFRDNLPATVHIKASGGIRTYEQAKEMVEAGADRLGCSAGVAIAAGEKEAAAGRGGLGGNGSGKKAAAAAAVASSSNAY